MNRKIETLFVCFCCCVNIATANVAANIVINHLLEIYLILNSALIWLNNGSKSTYLHFPSSFLHNIHLGQAYFPLTNCSGRFVGARSLTTNCPPHRVIIRRTFLIRSNESSPVDCLLITPLDTKIQLEARSANDSSSTSNWRHISKCVKRNYSTALWLCVCVCLSFLPDRFAATNLHLSF